MAAFPQPAGLFGTGPWGIPPLGGSAAPTHTIDGSGTSPIVAHANPLSTGAVVALSTIFIDGSGTSPIVAHANPLSTGARIRGGAQPPAIADQPGGAQWWWNDEGSLLGMELLGLLSDEPEEN